MITKKKALSNAEKQKRYRERQKDKGKKELRLQRAILMDHVDLGFVAQYDRKL